MFGITYIYGENGTVKGVMAKDIRKKQTNEKRVRTIILISLYAVLAIFIVVLFVFNANYSGIYKSPKVVNGKIDIANYSSNDLPCNLAGEWEFFYNKWIVTDYITCEPDGMIKLPDMWTYKDFGSGKLPKSGYASYRLYAENVKPGLELNVYRHYSNIAYRVFINGQFNYRSGNLSKNISETKVTGDVDECVPYKTDGSPIEIVIEIGACNIGGLNAAPWITATPSGNSFGVNLRALNYIAIGVTTTAVLLSLLTYVLFKYKRDITVPLFMLALYAHFLMSKDLLHIIEIPPAVAMVSELVAALVAFVLFVLHLYRNGATVSKRLAIPTAVGAMLFTALTIAFYGTPLAQIFAFMAFAIGCVYLVPICFNKKFTTIRYVFYGILFVMLMFVLNFELADWLGMLVFGTEYIFSFMMMIIIGCFALLWMLKFAKAARDAMRVSELERELSMLQNQALKAQIKPHFIYNSLTAIQSQYRSGLETGDRAIEQFAAHLRLITDSNDADMIPFDDEVRNVLNYFELENLRAGGTLELLLDIDYSDFTVPVLSLQPLVENAIRHGGLRDKLDGYISLSSVKADASIIITVSDNGKGFDINETKAGVGLENTRKRFESINAKMSVESKPGFGTNITIELPLEKT